MNVSRICIIAGILACVFAQSQSPQTQEARLAELRAKEKEAAALLEEMRKKDSISGNWYLFQSHTAELASAYRKIGRQPEVEKLLQSTLATLGDNGFKDDTLCAPLYNWQGFIYRGADRYTEALEAYDKVVRIYGRFERIGDKPSYACKQIAQFYIMRDNYEQAGQYFKEALRTDTSGKYHCNILSQIAHSYYWQDSFALARQYYDLSMQPEAVKKAAPGHLASARLVGILIFNKEKKYALARKSIIELLTTYKNDLGEYILRVYAALAEVALAEGKPAEAEKHYRTALAACADLYDRKSREAAKLYLETGNFFENTGRPDSALFYYQKALIEAFPDFNDPSPEANPPLSAAWIESQAMAAALAKARFLAKKRTKTAADHANIAHCYDLYFAVASVMRRSYGQDADKMKLVAAGRTACSEAVQNLLQWYTLNRDEALKARLFTLFERARSQALLDALSQQRAVALSGIPGEELAREDGLRKALTGATEAMNAARPSGDSILRAAEAWHFKKEREWSDYIEYLEKKYPAFRNFRASEQIAELSPLQAGLADTAAVLSYFDAGDRFVNLYIRRHSVQVFESPKNDSLQTLIGLLNDPVRQVEKASEFFGLSFGLYQRLIPEEGLKGVKNLLIVPDGALNGLPFEALLTGPHKGRFSEAPWLLNICAIRYAWNVSLLQLPVPQRKAGKGVLSVSPFASGAVRNMPQLSGDLDKAIFKGKQSSLDDHTASAEAFFEQAPRYSILHLNTHASAAGLREPRIEMYDRPLSESEFYGRRFTAELATLSACETGAGKYARGEGVISLARAFAYAGVRSLVAGHWSVNDRSTAAVFSDFYRGIERGLCKSEALRLAKRQYLQSETPDARKAPYYWAGLTLGGADEPVIPDAGMQWYWWVVMCMVLAGVLWFFRKKTKFAPR